MTIIKQLEQTGELYQKMLDEVQDYVIILINKEGIIQNWNRGAEKIKGYAAEEVIGKNFSIFYPPEDRANGLPKKLLTEATEHGRTIYEGWRVRKNGSRFWGSTVITAVHNEEGDTIGFVKVTRDLTEKKLAEDELKEWARKLAEKNEELAKSNQELEQFAYIASHDLQEPLRKIRTYAGMLEESLDNKLDPASKNILDKVITSAKRMSSLIQALLNYSRINESESEFVPIDLNKVVQNAINDCELIIGQTGAVIQSGTLPVIQALPLQMNQLFYNLLNNSLKFSRKNEVPVINITCRQLSREETAARKNLSPGSRYYQISIHDNGIGFDQQYAEHIFEAFKRLQSKSAYPGSGIGLALCRKIVLNHHGDIYAESIEQKGSVFHVVLPAMQPEG